MNRNSVLLRMLSVQAIIEDHSHYKMKEKTWCVLPSTRCVEWFLRSSIPFVSRRESVDCYMYTFVLKSSVHEHRKERRRACNSCTSSRALSPLLKSERINMLPEWFHSFVSRAFFVFPPTSNLRIACCARTLLVSLFFSCALDALDQKTTKRILEANWQQ